MRGGKTSPIIEEKPKKKPKKPGKKVKPKVPTKKVALAMPDQAGRPAGGGDHVL